MTEYKACSKCKQLKPTSEFGIHSTTSDGFYSQCLICHRQARAIYRQKHADKIKIEQKLHYQKNAESKKAYALAWHKANPEKFAKYQRISKKRNKEAVAADTRRRNARRKQNGVFAISKQELIKLSKQNCFYCGSSQRITIDHVVAIARGGTDSIGNLVPACKSCNSSKRQLTIMEWRMFRAKGNPPKPKL
jgi:5-methylcytosine-specific restriction endonuclease McrA